MRWVQRRDLPKPDLRWVQQCSAERYCVQALRVRYISTRCSKGILASTFGCPSPCKSVRGLIMAFKHLTEQRWLEDRIIRTAAGSEYLGVVWIGDGRQSQLSADMVPGGGEAFLKMTQDLAQVSVPGDRQSPVILYMGNSPGSSRNGRLSGPFRSKRCLCLETLGSRACLCFTSWGRPRNGHSSATRVSLRASKSLERYVRNVRCRRSVCWRQHGFLMGSLCWRSLDSQSYFFGSGG